MDGRGNYEILRIAVLISDDGDDDDDEKLSIHLGHNIHGYNCERRVPCLVQRIHFVEHASLCLFTFTLPRLTLPQRFS